MGQAQAQEKGRWSEWNEPKDKKKKYDSSWGKTERPGGYADVYDAKASTKPTYYGTFYNDDGTVAYYIPRENAFVAMGGLLLAGALIGTLFYHYYLKWR